MSNIGFLAGLGAVLALLLGWGFKHLPGERWQMLAVVPMKKNNLDSWAGANLTFYGFFIATSQLISLMLLMVLLHAAGISIIGASFAVVIVLMFCVPAARLVAIIVEKKRHTFTIGGASFVGIILAPWIIQIAENILNRGGEYFMPLIPLLAAMSIAYTLGEGLGRLGCISYGCCYGKPLKNSGRIVQFLFSRMNFIFHGNNKKVAYEARLHGEKLIPIQAITCIIYTIGALLGSYLFLNGFFTHALLLTMMLTQLWRILSETLRADFRGFGKISLYQKMGIISAFYILVVAFCMDQPLQVAPNVEHGIQILWHPGIIVGLQLLWLIFFVVFGRSSVTTSTVSFNLVKENI